MAAKANMMRRMRPTMASLLRISSLKVDRNLFSVRAKPPFIDVAILSSVF